MKQLIQTLTAAESLLLRKGDSTPKQEMLKVTLMDLLLRQVLTVETTEMQSNSRDPVRTLQKVKRGEAFMRYDALPHELVYLHDFRQSRDLEMSFRDCVRVGFENAQSEKKLQHAVRSSPALKDSFRQVWIQKIIGGFDYTDEGFSKRLQLEDEIKVWEERIPKLLETNREQALAELRTLGGNVFLLQGLCIVLLANIENEFFKHIPVPEKSQGCGGGCGTFTPYSSDFDGSYPTDSDGSDGSCSGDGGCSSGCGGCGD